jgi:ribosomal protein S16
MVKRQKARRLQRVVGGFTPLRVTEWFKSGVIDRDTAKRLYIESGLTEEQAERSIRLALIALKSERVASKVRIIKKRYLVGDLLPDQAKALLVKVGVELDKANELVDDWEVEIQVRSKQVAAGMLCRWYYRNLISSDEYAIRLRRIGYQPDDVSRIIAECSASSAEKRADRMVKNIRHKKVIKESLGSGGGSGNPD